MTESSPQNKKANSTGAWTVGQSAQTLKPGLYIVPTPLGNLRDITLRALDVLSAADTIYCEDTRVTQKLCQAYGIKASLERSDEHTEVKRAADIMEAVKTGKIIALVSDAGTPGVSDPGAKVVAACRNADIPIVALPGPSAVLTALSGSGFIHESFTFLGFLPPKSGARRAIFQKYMSLDSVLITYEAPQRVQGLLEDVQLILGDRQIVIARELTKMFETYYRGTPNELLPQIDDANFKGEVVVLIAPGAEKVTDEAAIDDHLLSLFEQMSLKEAVAQVTAKTGLPRKTVYARALALGRRDE